MKEERGSHAFGGCRILNNPNFGLAHQQCKSVTDRRNECQSLVDTFQLTRKTNLTGLVYTTDRTDSLHHEPALARVFVASNVTQITGIRNLFGQHMKHGKPVAREKEKRQ